MDRARGWAGIGWDGATPSHCEPARSGVHNGAVGAGISGEMVRDMMLDCVERRFDAVHALAPVQWLADNARHIPT